MSESVQTQSYDEQEFMQLVAVCLQCADQGMYQTLTEITDALHELDPERPEVLLLRGIQMRIYGEHHESESTLKALIMRCPSMTLAHYHLGKSYQSMQKYAEAADAFAACTEIDPEFVDAYSALSAVSDSLGKPEMGMQVAVHALMLEPTSQQLWSHVGSLLAKVQFNTRYAELENALIQAFEAGIGGGDVFAHAAMRCLDTSSSMRQIFEIHEAGSLETALQSGTILPLLNEPFFLSVTAHTLLLQPRFESLYTQLRKSCLQMIAGQHYQSEHAEALLRFSGALCSHCFANEYAFYETQEETQHLNEIIEMFSGESNDSDAHKDLCVAILGCYRLFYDLEICDALASYIDEKGGPILSRIAALMIEQPEREARYKNEVEAITDIDDDVSKLVQEMYEAHPYPRWITLPAIQPLAFELLIKGTMPFLTNDQLPRLLQNEHEALNILVAGCGTGQHPCMVAKRYPNAKVLAVDLSRSSLGYAQMKADELGIENIEFRHGDIMKLPELNRQFDIIESIGVLHHMQDPIKGWQAITDCLKPGGWMHIGLYDYHKRDFVRWSWDKIKEEAYGNSDEEIRRFRKDMLEYHDQNPENDVCNRMMQTKDFYLLSECRDLLFHVQETQYTLNELRKIINTLGLRFMGMPTSGLGQWELLKEGEDPIKQWQSMKQWEAARLAKPHLFHHMHMLWLKKPA